MRVLIADDHRLIVEGVKTKLSELEHEVEFVVAMNIAEFDAVLNRSDSGLDLAIIDISMPGAQGHRHIAEMRRVAADVPIIVLSGSEDTELIRTLLELGVQGFIPKAYSPDVMLSAVRLVLSGGVYVPPLLLAGVQARGWTPAVEIPAAARNLSTAAEQHSLDGLRQILTERQIDVMRLLSQGKPNKLIARSLGISEGTVKIHLAAIFRALNVRNRVEAVVASRRLVEP
ncbi:MULTISPECIES: response regulator transcription factor [unclassified Lysobacter]|uniref:response regulator n=1 Tax=unclassified Lysobacter TaxID=2635362 RepID=UPI001BE4E536|nr:MULTISPECIES: response regulator transcription factor [unclassified Lysobacter]MBT2744829.1 response regulator transcription factor [Lysobacter sp. ISL-42]MBT2752178.1 response regulator transcription factor [Lysobacter sp. ISL-50]MBT2778675.1 response regulator transcription factor [Lysobacter sp. ISL-54]MBT2780394.1 response regulator transcription factor [Lysobacter sp. ISL-52]